MDNYPPCFGSLESWNIWLTKATESGLENPEKNFCIDCTPSFQKLAIEYGTCTRPTTFFLNVLTEDGEAEVVGISFDEEW